MKSFSALSAAGRRAACLPGRRLFACEDGRRLYAPVAAARPRDRHTRALLGVVDLEARPGPAAAWRPRGLACRHSNFACNSPAACSNIEFASLELQRFLRLLKFGPIELHAKFVWRWSCQPMLALPTGSLHRGLALRFLRTLRRPPDRWGLVCCCVG